MSDPQQSMFGGGSAKKAKAKALSKSTPLPAAPAKKLSPNDELIRAKNLASVRKTRAAMKIGELMMSEDPCSDCGGERIGEVIGVEPQGGITMEWRCLKCSSSR